MDSYEASCLSYGSAAESVGTTSHTIWRGVIALHGDLGAGKTTFARHPAGLGIQQRVTSPTFTLVNEYALENGWRLVHIDSYRLDRGGQGIELEKSRR